MKFDVLKIYEERLSIIDKQMKNARYKRNWGRHKELKREKDRLNEILNKRKNPPKAKSEGTEKSLKMNKTHN